MTQPYPAPGEFPNWEQFLSDLLTPICYTTDTLPATSALIQSTLPLIWARRVGGNLDKDAITDTAHVQVIAFGETRSQAIQLAVQIRDAILTAPATSVNGVIIDWAQEIKPIGIKYFPPILRRADGLTEFPDVDPLNEMVEVAFALDARRQS